MIKRTQVKQHQGASRYQTVEVQTDSAEIGDRPDCAEIFPQIHSARVRLAELDADHRAAAEEWLARNRLRYDSTTEHLAIDHAIEAER